MSSNLETSMAMCYTGNMSDTIAEQPTLPKAELERLSGAKPNHEINSIIERVVNGQNRGWELLRRWRGGLRQRADGDGVRSAQWRSERQGA